MSIQFVNYDKSGVMFSPNTDPKHSTTMLQILGMWQVDSHGKYLGLLLVVKNKNCGDINTVRKRIASCNGKLLLTRGK